MALLAVFRFSAVRFACSESLINGGDTHASIRGPFAIKDCKQKPP